MTSVVSPSFELAVADVPVERFLQLHHHLDALLAELDVISVPDGHEPPAEVVGLLPLIAGLRGPYAPISRRSKLAALEARGAGHDTFTLELTLPAEAPRAVTLWNRLLDSADSAASRGLMLTSPANPEIVELRRWIGAKVEQADT